MKFENKYSVICKTYILIYIFTFMLIKTQGLPIYEIQSKTLNSPSSYYNDNNDFISTKTENHKGSFLMNVLNGAPKKKLYPLPRSPDRIREIVDAMNEKQKKEGEEARIRYFIRKTFYLVMILTSKLGVYCLCKKRCCSSEDQEEQNSCENAIPLPYK